MFGSWSTTEFLTSTLYLSVLLLQRAVRERRDRSQEVRLHKAVPHPHCLWADPAHKQTAFVVAPPLPETQPQHFPGPHSVPLTPWPEPLLAPPLPACSGAWRYVPPLPSRSVILPSLYVSTRVLLAAGLRGECGGRGRLRTAASGRELVSSFLSSGLGAEARNARRGHGVPGGCTRSD